MAGEDRAVGAMQYAASGLIFQNLTGLGIGLCAEKNGYRTELAQLEDYYHSKLLDSSKCPICTYVATYNTNSLLSRWTTFFSTVKKEIWDSGGYLLIGTLRCF